MFCVIMLKIQSWGCHRDPGPYSSSEKTRQDFFSELNGLMTRITNEYVQEEEKKQKNVTLCTRTFLSGMTGGAVHGLGIGD